MDAGLFIYFPRDSGQYIYFKVFDGQETVSPPFKINCSSPNKERDQFQPFPNSTDCHNKHLAMPHGLWPSYSFFFFICAELSFVPCINSAKGYGLDIYIN